MPPRESAKSRWVFTLNNWTQAELDALLRHANTFKYLIVGKETGASGTPHLQGFFILPPNLRFRLAQVRNLPGLRRAHFEPARGTSLQASQYCKKDGNFEEFGDLPSDGPKTNIFASFRDWVKELDHTPTITEVWEERPEMVRYDKQVHECIRLFGKKPPLVDGQPRGWQLELKRMLEEPADDRKIHYVVDPVGNTGKSWFCRYMLQEHRDDVQILSVGKRDDLAYAIDETKRIFLFDIPRKCMEYFQYPVVEALKNKLVFSSKYNSKMKELPGNVHVCIFSNEEPDRNAQTSDRYKVIRIRRI